MSYPLPAEALPQSEGGSWCVGVGVALFSLSVRSPDKIGTHHTQSLAPTHNS